MDIWQGMHVNLSFSQSISKNEKHIPSGDKMIPVQYNTKSEVEFALGVVFA